MSTKIYKNGFRYRSKTILNKWGPPYTIYLKRDTRGIERQINESEYRKVIQQL